MDWVRTCYRTRMDLWGPDQPPVPVRWFRAQKGAKFFPHASAFGVVDWNRDKGDDGSGNLLGTRGRYDKGAPWVHYPGQDFHGRAEAFLDGGTVGLDTPLLTGWDGAIDECRTPPGPAFPLQARKLGMVFSIEARVAGAERDAALPFTLDLSAAVSGPTVSETASLAFSLQAVVIYTEALVDYQHDGTLVGSRNKLNFETPTNLTLAIADNPTHGRVDVLIDLASVPTSILVGTFPYASLTGTPSIPTYANPTASAGLAAINGTATTFMRSDAAPQISQAITPTWTGLHTYTNGIVISGGGVNVTGVTSATYQQSAGTVKVVIKTAASETANAWETRDSANTLKTWVDQNHKLRSVQDIVANSTASTEVQIGARGPGGVAGVSMGVSSDCSLGRTAARTLGISANVALASQAVGDTPLKVWAIAAQTGNLLEIASAGGTTVYVTVSENGYITNRKNAAPASGELSASEACWWFDSTNGASKFVVTGKQADATVKTAQLPVTNGDTTTFLDGTGAFSKPQPWTYGPYVAGGSVQADATEISTNGADVTGCNGVKGVRFKSGMVGPITVHSDGSLLVYPESGSAISGNGANNPLTISSLSPVVFFRVSATQWYWNGLN